MDTHMPGMRVRAPGMKADAAGFNACAAHTQAEHSSQGSVDLHVTVIT